MAYLSKLNDLLKTLLFDSIELDELVNFIVDRITLTKFVGCFWGLKEDNNDIYQFQDIESVILYKVFDLLGIFELAQIEVFHLRVVIQMELKQSLQLFEGVLYKFEYDSLMNNHATLFFGLGINQQS